MINKIYIEELNHVWRDLYQQAYDALLYVDCDNECNGEFKNILDNLEYRYLIVMHHIMEDKENG